MPGMKSGDVVGHEFMGIVDDVGPEVTKFKKGNRLSFFRLCEEYILHHQQISAGNFNAVTFAQVIAWLLLV